MASLKLRPQFQLNAEQRIILVDARPAYDHVPTVDELLQDAARNHELERAFYGQKTSSRVTRREAYSQWLEQTARDFLADPTCRAIVHPAPTARMCQLATSRGPIYFYAKVGSGVVRQVPLEAYRRFQNDLRIRRGQTEMQREHDVAINAERRRLMEEWVDAHGTPDQRQRFAAGAMTPEALEAEIKALQPARVAWRDIAWKSCLLEGLKESRAKGKPLLLWIFIDRPADDARC